MKQRAVFLLLALAAVVACGRPSNMYCQSGPKQGTQCYTSGGTGAGDGPGQDPYKGRGESPNSLLLPTR